MSFYNSAIAALFPLLMAITSPQPNISTNSVIAQSTLPTKSQSHPKILPTTSPKSAIAPSWDSSRLLHTIPDSH